MSSVRFRTCSRKSSCGQSRRVIRSPALPYIAPFAVFLGFLALHSILPLPDLGDQILRLAVMTLVLFFVARPVLDFNVQHWVASVLIGVAVFAIWIGPDLLFPNYRRHWMFENSIMGAASTTLSAN